MARTVPWHEFYRVVETPATDDALHNNRSVGFSPGNPARRRFGRCCDTYGTTNKRESCCPPSALWEGEAPAEPNTYQAPDSRHSAKACPLGRAKLLLSRTSTAHVIPTARREPRPPKIQSYGSAGASPSQNTIVRLGRSLALPKYNPTAGWASAQAHPCGHAVFRPANGTCCLKSTLV